jgi:hypothetical protein
MLTLQYLYLRAFSPATEDSFQQPTVVGWQMTHPSRCSHWLDREATDETDVSGKQRKTVAYPSSAPHSIRG